MLSSTELAVDKVLAIFGRAEARDFVDFAAVVDQHGLESVFRLAAEKDRGFSIDVFSEMLQRFDRLRQDEFASTAWPTRLSLPPWRPGGRYPSISVAVLGRNSVIGAPASEMSFISSHACRTGHFSRGPRAIRVENPWSELLRCVFWRVTASAR